MLKLSQALYDQIIAHCKREAPKEACGMLGGKDAIAQTVYVMTNVDQSPISYAMDPKEQLQVMKQMRTAQEDTVGIYHSHTATDAYPSPVDVRLCISEDISYVLVSLKDPKQPVLRSFRIVDTHINEEPVEVR